MHQNIEIDPAVIETFNGIKMKGTNTYMVLKINEESKIAIEHIGEKGAAWDAMCDALPDDDGRYIVFDYKKKLDDGREISRLLFVYWCPDSVKISRKVQLSSNKVPVETKVPCQISISCTDRSDLEAAEVERSIK
jgi:cofilin